MRDTPGMRTHMLREDVSAVRSAGRHSASPRSSRKNVAFIGDPRGIMWPLLTRLL